MMKSNNSDLLIRLGENLASIRKSRNLTLRELSERCNVDFSAIGKIEKGKKNISVLTLADLAQGLEVHPKKLLDFKIER